MGIIKTSTQAEQAHQAAAPQLAPAPKMVGEGMFVDNRPEVAAQLQRMEMMSNSPQAMQQKARMSLIANSQNTLQQKSSIDRITGQTSALAQREEDPLQAQSESEAPIQCETQDSPKPNNTGLPDQLKSGIESLSGMSMDHVKVHYNSSQPAQLNALAYAQGSEIHIGAGQEQHLPHEAWHVVQQAQGRVKPTMQMKDGVPVNDDVGLEHEADVIGAKALGLYADPTQLKGANSKGIRIHNVAQMQWPFPPGGDDHETKATLSAARRFAASGDFIHAFAMLATLFPDSALAFHNIRPALRDPEYENKINAIRNILSETFNSEGLFSLDEIIAAISQSEIVNGTTDTPATSESSGVEDDDGYISDPAADLEAAEREAEQEAFERKQLENRGIVLEAAARAEEMIAGCLARSGAFQENLGLIRTYIHDKAALFDEGHFLCEPDDDGPVNELAHSTPGSGVISVFKGFFEANVDRRAELLIHESVHSLLKVPDYAYIWQPIFRFLPEATRLRNPDSYVAVIRGLHDQEVDTPTTGDIKNDRILGMIQHVCMRGLEQMNMCQKQMESFDLEVVPQPLARLKAARPALTKEHITLLINIALPMAAQISGLVIGKRIVIRTLDPPPETIDAAITSNTEGVLTVDFINSTTQPPFLTMLAKIMISLGMSTPWAKNIAIALNLLVHGGHMTSDTLERV